MFADVAAGAVSPQAADDLYAVKLHDDGSVDRRRRAKLRERRFLERLRECGAEREELVAVSEPPAGAESFGDAYLDRPRGGGADAAFAARPTSGRLQGNAKERMAVQRAARPPR